METLLFIEDDDGIRLALSMALEDEGYSVREAANGADGLASFRQAPPDLVLLDLRLPDMSGFDVCRALRAESIVPIIMITAQTDTHDMVAGLEAGADDYVTKPVVPKELAARIRASLRRVALHGKATTPLASRFGDVEVRREQGIVLKGGVEVNLTKTEFRLMCEFADHAGAVLSRDQLLERGLGLRVPRRFAPRRRPCPAAAPQDRGSPRRPTADRHLAGRRLPVDGRLITARVLTWRRGPRSRRRTW